MNQFVTWAYIFAKFYNLKFFQIFFKRNDFERLKTFSLDKK